MSFSRYFILLLALLAFSAGANAQLVSRGPWSGAVTAYSAEVNLVLFESRLTTLEVSSDRDFVRKLTFPEEPRRKSDLPLLTRYRLKRLEPNTTYYYRVVAGRDRERQRVGQLRTGPIPGQAASFRFIVAGGAATGSEAGAFSEIRYQAPLFFVQLGNLHNASINANDARVFAETYHRVLDSFTHVELLQRVPAVYTWDRFDYGQGADRESPNAFPAHLTYRHYIPHYPLPADSAPELADDLIGEKPITQAFTVGRVRFIVLDTRTQRTPVNTPEGPEKSMLGKWQREWLENELVRAQSNHVLTFILTSVPWHASGTPYADDWSRYTHERNEIAQWISDQGLRNIAFISANGGTLSAVTGTAAPDQLPEFQVGEIDLHFNHVEGPWDVGPLFREETEEFFGVFDIDDNRSSIKVTFIGMNQNGSERLRTVLEFSVN
ncbi:alkaline phosphatase D family protein [Synoicihabitans lomoniglobus]|uniref:Alkaline phosphatase D family protein n=1 Tax=Synoicihabitans lomoniglobus TaxID=2909285 RepID=A0AAF0CNW7_9BACT|nr:alkaline phosphatase D family protein [Opitutaceae bacterium LMO-M01]WED64985.1 alkaline phosphatase D family protein [Opitutaceae bacterium LMO-M01]